MDDERKPVSMDLDQDHSPAVPEPQQPAAPAPTLDPSPTTTCFSPGAGKPWTEGELKLLNNITEEQGGQNANWTAVARELAQACPVLEGRSPRSWEGCKDKWMLAHGFYHKRSRSDRIDHSQKTHQPPQLRNEYCAYDSDSDGEEQVLDEDDELYEEDDPSRASRRPRSRRCMENGEEDEDEDDFGVPLDEEDCQRMQHQPPPARAAPAQRAWSPEDLQYLSTAVAHYKASLGLSVMTVTDWEAIGGSFSPPRTAGSCKAKHRVLGLARGSRESFSPIVTSLDRDEENLTAQTDGGHRQRWSQQDCAELIGLVQRLLQESGSSVVRPAQLEEFAASLNPPRRGWSCYAKYMKIRGEVKDVGEEGGPIRGLSASESATPVQPTLSATPGQTVSRPLRITPVVSVRQQPFTPADDDLLRRLHDLHPQMYKKISRMMDPPRHKKEVRERLEKLLSQPTPPQPRYFEAPSFLSPSPSVPTKRPLSPISHEQPTQRPRSASTPASTSPSAGLIKSKELNQSLLQQYISDARLKRTTGSQLAKQSNLGFDVQAVQVLARLLAPPHSKAPVTARPIAEAVQPALTHFSYASPPPRADLQTTLDHGSPSTEDSDDCDEWCTCDHPKPEPTGTFEEAWDALQELSKPYRSFCSCD